ncbi:DUF547 domain-containing protein [Nibrella viscosa]
MKRYSTLAALFILVAAFTAFRPLMNPLVVDHSGWNRLLKEHVDERGLVDYKGFKKDEKELKKYLDLLSKNPPSDKWSQDEQMAYWINAYNAYTVQLILDHYPVSSIKDIGSKIKIPFVNTPWDIKFIEIGGQKYDLNNIEHGILRRKFNDPRIHFVLVCAAVSCPRLRNEAYTADKLDRQMDEQGRDFLNNPARNDIKKGEASLSKLFDWYKMDWNKDGKSVAYWVNRYANTKIDKNTRIAYQDYNWSLNEQK